METKLSMSVELAEKMAELALAGLEREFPNKPGVVMHQLEDVKRPKEMYPVFYGHFDWHSSVHAHWTLVRLLRVFPDLASADAIRSALSRKFSQNKLQAEADNLLRNPSFERMYGWAWALRLGVELRELAGQDAQLWSEWYAPVEQAIVANAKTFLPKLDWPVRCGFHPESAFPLGQMLDWARATGEKSFEELITKRAIHFYARDVDYPAAYEPSGNDFFSAGLNEADLMRRVLPQAEFEQWLDQFLPGLKHGKAGNLLNPVTVSDLHDGHLVHLVGLNLSRAWAMRGIATSLPDSSQALLIAAADQHAKAGLAQVSSGSYEGEHWLGTFAVYLMTEVGIS